MGSLVYIRLIGCTFGTLLQLFWMVVILGYRRQRNFERVFFFLCLALFFFYGGVVLGFYSLVFLCHPPPARHQILMLIIFSRPFFVSHAPFLVSPRKRAKGRASPK